jgi:cGMP-dependent protein kinase
MIDMGTAKHLNQAKGYRTFTMIGTPHYMAPEVMQGKGYTFAVDLWSLGVMLYEFLFKELPFAQDLD